MSKRIWFRARDYGWGWYPVAWQGWVVLAVWLGVFVGITANLDPNAPLFWSLALAFGSVLILLIICWKTGERPTWRWAGKQISPQRGIAYSLLLVAGAFCIAAIVAFATSKLRNERSPFYPPREGVACTQDARQCPDGSYVGRTEPGCQFAPCPGGDM